MSTSPRVLVAADARAFHTARYVTELRRQGCEVRLVSMEKGEIEHCQLKARGPVAALHYALAAAELRRIVDEFRPDVVNPHFASGYGYLVARAQKTGFPPIMLNLWGSDILIVPKKSFLHRYKTKVALEAADAVTGDSEYLLDEAAKVGRLARREMIVWGVERKYLELRRKEFRWQRPLRVIVPRSQEAVYNNAFIVEALAELVNEGLVELTLAGFGSLLSEIKVRSEQLTGGRVRFYEKLGRDDYMKLLATQDVYLSASRSDSSPVSLLEAMGLGVIAVVGDIPGVREWIDDDSGFRFTLNDAASLRNIFGRLLSSDCEVNAMRARNMARVECAAIYEENVARMIAIMRELVARRRV